MSAGQYIIQQILDGWEHLMAWQKYFANITWRTLRKKAHVLLSVHVFLIQCVWNPAIGQQLPSDIDLDPPVIDHEALVRGVAGEPQLFSAVIVDDRGIESVQLFYRPATDGEYTSVPMTLSGSSYIATLQTDENQRRIEYYIEVLDTGGNRVLKGFPFYPLVRGLSIPKAPQPQITQPPPPSQQEPAKKSGNTVLYVMLGVLALGLLAGASGGGSGGGGDSQPSNQVPLTINVSPP
ncbi:hypothetical protein AB833_22705 [Chromatiales bacterium (ex Bugula neritina AB1)]|nr:hypothetical protein AB833_22705 [Chromatiales bacterium (ex Bugula neritina AB1)]